MIKLTLPEKPAELTEAEVARLTAEFKNDSSKTVWKQDYIETALMKMSNGKCAYSEQRIGEESAYMEIEHFKHKNLYKDDVVKWGNLLPSCKKCNTVKGEWDVVSDPIVNPLVDTPKDHLFIRGFRFYERDTKGHNTILAVALNDREHFVNPRSKIALRIVDEIEAAFSHLQELTQKRARHLQTQKIKSLMEECGPEYEYSAVVSTYLLYEWYYYPEMERYLRDAGLWDTEFDGIVGRLREIAMPQQEERRDADEGADGVASHGGEK